MSRWGMVPRSALTLLAKWDIRAGCGACAEAAIAYSGYGAPN
jgi:hypothetical protein